MSTVFLATLDHDHFWSYGPSWTNINVDKVIECLSANNRSVRKVRILDLPKIDLGSEDVVIYTSSDDAEVRQYVRDVIYLTSKKCRVVPSYEALLAHENKGFQQLVRDQLGFGNLDGRYGYSIEILGSDRPYVFKPISGAGSKGVQLARSKSDVRLLERKYFTRSPRRVITDLARRFKLSSKDFKHYKSRKAPYFASVLQNFVPGLDHDYKILIFFDKVYALRRGVREGDFRASGSGKLSFAKPSERVLEFALNVHNQLNSPYSSLDIVVDASGMPSLIEYQCVSFGPYAVVRSPGYFLKSSGGWGYREDSTTLEDVLCYAIENWVFGANLERP